MLETAVLFKHWTFQAYLGLTMVPISTTRLPSDEECSTLMIHSMIESFTTLSFSILLPSGACPLGLPLQDGRQLENRNVPTFGEN